MVAFKFDRPIASTCSTCGAAITDTAVVSRVYIGTFCSAACLRSAIEEG